MEVQEVFLEELEEQAAVLIQLELPELEAQAAAAAVLQLL
jgi:hypothetical protein